MPSSAGQGECGQTTLVDQTCAWKDDPRVAAAGDLDELGSWLGVVAAHLPPACDTQREQLVRIQRELFALGVVAQSKGARGLDEQVLARSRMDAWTALMDAKLAAAAGFILPGGAPAAAFAHVARTVCRRAERSMMPLLRDATGTAALHLQGACERLNHLGYWLFVLARFVDQAQGVSDGGAN
jgi:cob(I)alamin adenosyltransferase